MTVGEPIVRVEDERLLRGNGTYIDDVAVPGAHHAAFLRSPLAHAEIRAIDVARAMELDGVRAVVVADDLAALDRPLPQARPDSPALRTERPLARDRVYHVGQAIAMVVAETRYIAEDALELIEVEFEPLPVVVDLEAAADAGAPLVHDDLDSNVGGRVVQRVGNPDAAFADAPYTFSARYVLERSAPMPMETRGIVARFDQATHELTVWDQTQTPYPMRAFLVDQLGLSEQTVRVIVPDTGGSFGGKGPITPEHLLIPWAAKHLGVPVKWMEDRVEHFTSTRHERKQVHFVEVAATADGVVLAVRDRFLHDSGAFTPYGLTIPVNTVGHLAGTYRVPNLEIEGVSIYTNTVATTPYRGAGRPQACFVMERVLDRLARDLGIDRAEIRRRNLITKHEMPYERPGLTTVIDGYRVVLDSGDYERQFEMVLEALDYERFETVREQAKAEGRRLGIGFGCYIEATGVGPFESAQVTVQPGSGTVRVMSGLTSQGQGHETSFAQIVAQVLGVAVHDIVVARGDTQELPTGVGTGASRGLVAGGNAVWQAAELVKEKALRIAANMLKASEADLELRDGAVMPRGARGRAITLGEIAAAASPGYYQVAARAGDARSLLPPFPTRAADVGPKLPPMESPGLSMVAYFSPENAAWGTGAHGAIVEVDDATGEVRYLQYVAIHDCGRVVNPLIVRGQVVGGVAQGIGGSLYERIVYGEDGQLRNASFLDFLIPYATEIPPVHTAHLESVSPMNPLGVKGTGEGGVIAVPAVTASAVEDALSDLGVEITELPLDPSTLRAVIRARLSEE